MLATLAKLQSWTARRKSLFAGVVRVIAKPVLAYATGDHAVADAYGDLVGAGLSEALGLIAGEPAKSTSDNYAERLDRMADLCGDLLTQLEAAPDLKSLPDDLNAVEDRLHDLLRKNDDLRTQLTALSRPLLQQALSIGRIEQKLDAIAREHLNYTGALEDLKQLLIASPMYADWDQFRRADPEAVKLLIEADRHFLAGRRKEGLDCLKKIAHLRGFAGDALGYHTGMHQIGSGDMQTGRTTLLSIPAASPLTATLGGRPGGPIWRALPRGLVINRKYRIEEEVGRGGMASVYRAVGEDRKNKGKQFAIKVPAPGVLGGEELLDRFIREIEIAESLSKGDPPQLVLTIGYEPFPDPHSGEELYALVMEYVDGENLARHLARRQMEKRPLECEEIIAILTPVCEALEIAHNRKEPVIHRDGKPHNIMLGRDGRAKLMDFGIARLLDEADPLTRTGQIVGTIDYLPPELRLPNGTVDVRTDVYLLGTLLQEMMTFHPCGDPDSRPDLPPAWAELIADATSRQRTRRPASAREFFESAGRGVFAAKRRLCREVDVKSMKGEEGNATEVGTSVKTIAPLAEIGINNKARIRKASSGALFMLAEAARKWV